MPVNQGIHQHRMRNYLSRVLIEGAWEARGTDTLYVWLPRKVAMESSSSCHHGV